MTQQDFLKDTDDPCNHRPLLWFALELTKDNDLPVVEYGAGNGSTKYLRQYCKDENRPFISYDSNEEWAKIHSSKWVTNWEDYHYYGLESVALIDQAPGEFRHISMRNLKDDAQIIVVHDAEPDESMGYRLSEVFPLFKYKVFVKGEKIWSAAVSNHYDLTKHVGEKIGEFTIEL